jgi:hypothetical protein
VRVKDHEELESKYSNLDRKYHYEIRCLKDEIEKFAFSFENALTPALIKNTIKINTSAVIFFYNVRE